MPLGVYYAYFPDGQGLPGSIWQGLPDTAWAICGNLWPGKYA